jgi:hypothetical protein
MALDIAARELCMNVPSPLAGEGMTPFQQVKLGEGSRAQRAHRKHPSPTLLSLQDHAALSRKGRGHSHAQPLQRTNRGGA